MKYRNVTFSVKCWNAQLNFSANLFDGAETYMIYVVVVYVHVPGGLCMVI